MGPGTDKASQSGIADPPMFIPSKDNYAWRKEIANWVDLIKVGAEQGEDKLYKTVFKDTWASALQAAGHSVEVGRRPSNEMERECREK